MNSNEINELTLLIENILGQNNQLRAQSEELFVQFKEKNPDKFTLFLLTIVKVSQNLGVKNFAIVMLRKNLSVFSEKSFTPLWGKLQPETQKIFKNEVFSILQHENTKLGRNMLADLIGEVAGTVLNFDPEEAKGNQEVNQWPDLMNDTFSFYVNGANPLKVAALKILTTLFTFADQEFTIYKTQLHNIFKTGLENLDNDVKLAAFQALGSFIEICEPSDVKNFEDLLPLLLETTIGLLGFDEQMGSDALGVLVDIAESEPKFYKKNFNLLFTTMAKIASVKKMDQEGIKQLAIEIVTSVLERLPKIIRNSDQAMKEVLEMVFSYMIEISPTVEPEWEKPKEGFNDELGDDSESTTIKYGIHVIDRLISSIGEKKLIPNLSNLIYTMLNNTTDWRYKHAALMALSQVGEYVEELDEIEPIIKYVLTFYADPHPKIRYAALHCTGQICDDMQPEFQTRFHEMVVPNLLKLCEDSIPRVVGHSLAALTNFFEGTKTEIALKYVDAVLKTSFHWIQHGISLVKENAMSTIASISESVKEGYIPYFDESMQILYNVLTTYTSKEYRQLRGQTIECITLIANAVGFEHFKKYSDQIIQVLIQIQENTIDDIDPQKSYLLSGWQRLCIIMGDAIIPYLERILPSLFKVASSILKISSTKQPSTSTASEEVKSLLNLMNGDEAKSKDKKDDKKLEINTYETEEAEIAVTMLSVFIKELKTAFLPYIQDAIQLLIPMCNYSQSEKIRKSAAKCLPGILNLINRSNNQDTKALLLTMNRMFTTALWNSLATEYDADVITVQIHCIKNCVDIVGKYMIPKELEDFSERILTCLKESDDRKAENEKLKYENDVEEEEVELLESDNDKEEDLHVAIAELIGVLFKTHKELTLPLVNVLYNQILSKVLQTNLSDKMHKFGIYLVDDMIEYLGIELIPDIWPSLSEVLLSFCLDKSPLVRQPAVYGVGVLAEKSKEIFGLITEISIQKIMEAINIPQDPSIHNKIHGHCRDNAIAALGKIIKHHSEKIPNIKSVVTYWINCLPLKYDHEEAIIQHQFLVEIISYGNAEVWAGPNYENLPQIIKIFSEIWNTDNISSNTGKSISTILKLLLEDQKTRSIIESIINNMTVEQQKAIHNAIIAN